MTFPIVENAKINLNVTSETIVIPVANVEWSVVEFVPDESTYTTWIGEVMYRTTPTTPWRSFSTALTLTTASPTSGLIGTVGIMYLGVRTTTKQGSASYGAVFANGDSTSLTASRIG